jgi:hypothetical protein
MTSTFIGVDVSQDHLDVHVRPAGQNRRFANAPAGIAELLAWVQPQAAQRILFESTGPYQKAAVGVLLAEGLPVVVVNARQVRDFAKAMNYLAKTDKIDAAVIAHFAEVAVTTVRPLESQEIRDLRELNDRRGQLVGMLAMEKNQRHSARVGQASAKVLRSIDKHIAYLEEQIRDLEQRMDCIIENSATFRARDDILQTITGIGPQVSRTLLAYLPELAIPPSDHYRLGRPGPVQRRQRHPQRRTTHSRRTEQGPCRPVSGGHRRHPALSADEGVLRRPEGTWEGVPSCHHRRGAQAPGARQRPDPGHGSVSRSGKLPLLKNLDTRHSHFGLVQKGP